MEREPKKTSDYTVYGSERLSAEEIELRSNVVEGLKERMYELEKSPAVQLLKSLESKIAVGTDVGAENYLKKEGVYDAIFKHPDVKLYIEVRKLVFTRLPAKETGYNNQEVHFGIS